MSVSGDRDDFVPPRGEWPTSPARTEAGDVFTEVILATFRLNGRLLEVAQGLAAEGGLTAAWWQVLGAVLDEPRSVPDIARRMGVTRQAVQRVADLLVDRGVAEYRPNPAHRRAKLIACTEAGHWAIRQIALAQRPWADRVASHIGADDLHRTLTTMRRLIEVIETEQATVPIGS
jgi:DNA-binding MarR family transcriptional regulator